jgi:protein-arginine kinase activator protein McsA
MHEECDADPLVICELCRIRTADVITELIMDGRMRNVNLCATCFVRVHKVEPDVVNNDG